MKKTQAKSKHPAKAAKVSGKVKTAPTKVRRLSGASAATGRPPWNSPNWGQAWDKFLWGEFEQMLATSKRTPKRQEELRKRYREKLTGWIKNMVEIRAASDAKWASMPTPPQSQVQTADAECEALIAAHLQEMEAKQDLEQHRTTQAFGRRALKALTLQDAGYSLAADVAVKVFPYPKKGSRDPNAPARNQLWISLEALSLWLQEFVEADGEKVPRWQTMPARSFRHHQRHSKYGWSESYIELNNAAGAWLWSEIGGAAHEDAHAGKALGYLLHRHQSAALEFLQRFLAARHSTQDKSRERMIDVAAAMESGNKDRLGKTSKKDRDRIRRDHKPPVE